MNNQQTDVDTIQGMRPTAWRPDGTPSHFEIVEHEPYVLGPGDPPTIASPVLDRGLPRVQHVVTGSPIDEARAFNIRVSSLAVVMGVLVVTLALVFGASLSFWLAALYFGTAFGLTWAVAFVLDVMRSAGGIELFHTFNLWNFIYREQAYRHRWLGAPAPGAPRWLAPVLLALAIGFSGLFLVLVLGAVAVELMPR